MTSTTLTVRRFALEVLPALLYVAGIFYGGSIPLQAPPIDVGLPFDKVLHLVVFAGLQVLLVRALRHGRSSFARKNGLAVAGASGLGLLLELYQATLPYRSAELMDWIADTAGALLAAAVLSGARRARRFLTSDAPPAAQSR